MIGILLTLVLRNGLPAGAIEPGPDESTAAYFQGLRERRLFRLAESYSPSNPRLRTP